MPTCRVDWPQAWRIIASRYPPINLFERLTADPTVWDALMALEQLTNPRLRDEIGEIALVPPDERVSGPGASYVMAAFTHSNPNGSRFSDGSYGVYYAAASLETAIAETAFHFEALARDSADPPRAEDFRVLVGTAAEDFEDADALPEVERHAVLDPDSYAASQAYAKRLRAQLPEGPTFRQAGGEAAERAVVNGVAYPSVRQVGGRCLAAFRPRAVGMPHQERHLQYRWNGERVDRYFDYARGEWIGLE